MAGGPRGESAAPAGRVEKEKGQETERAIERASERARERERGRGKEGFEPPHKLRGGRGSGRCKATQLRKATHLSGGTGSGGRGDGGSDTMGWGIGFRGNRL